MGEEKDLKEYMSNLVLGELLWKTRLARYQLDVKSDNRITGYESCHSCPWTERFCDCTYVLEERTNERSGKPERLWFIKSLFECDRLSPTFNLKAAELKDRRTETIKFLPCLYTVTECLKRNAIVRSKVYGT